MNKLYDYRNCQSLFRNAKAVHERSGGVCQLCGCGDGPDVDFDLWRQMTIEHLIGSSQGGYLGQIQTALLRRFPDLAVDQLEQLAYSIVDANTVTACSFCNSTTSRVRNPKSMVKLIEEAKGSPEETVEIVIGELGKVLEKKREDVKWKLKSIREGFDQQIRPELRAARYRRE